MSKIIISESDAYECQADWVAEVNKDSDLRNLFIKEKKVKDKEYLCLLTGIKIKFKDLLPIINSIGSHKVKVRFGIVRKSNFRLVLWSEDAQGNRTSDFLCTEEPEAIYTPLWLIDEAFPPEPITMNYEIFEAFLKSATKGSEQQTTGTLQDDEIPPVLAALWSIAWTILYAFNNGYNTQLFQTYTNDVLRGYTFHFNDFIKVFSNVKKDIFDTDIYINFLNHFSGNEKAHKFNFGLILTATSSSDAQNWALYNDTVQLGEKPSEDELKKYYESNIQKLYHQYVTYFANDPEGNTCWDHSSPCPPIC